LDERLGGIELAGTDHPRLRKSRHVEHPDLGPTLRDRLAELAPSDARHGDVGEHSLYPMGPSAEQANGLLSAARLQNTVAQARQHT
jgi:hypothetical protein